MLGLQRAIGIFLYSTSSCLRPIFTENVKINFSVKTYILLGNIIQYVEGVVFKII